MAIGNIFDIPTKTTINPSLQAKSFMVLGKSKSGKSTICSQAPRPVFLMTENGGEGLVGFTPIPIGSWSDFKSAVTQLCSKKGRENFDTVVIDTYTNLILLLDKYIGTKLTTDKNSLDFGSDAEYGRGSKAMRNELGIQLQKLANQGYILMNIVHAEDKVDFSTGKEYIGTSLSNSLYGVAEKFVDQIIYLRRDVKGDEIDYRICFNAKGGYLGTGGRYVTEEDFVPTSYENFEAAMVKAIQRKAEIQGAATLTSSVPSVTIENSTDQYNFPEMMSEFKAITAELMQRDSDLKFTIKGIVEAELGTNRKVSELTVSQAELLANILQGLKEFYELTINQEEKKENN